MFHCPTKCYSFGRPLTQIEWGILRSYTHRIRSITGGYALDWESVATFLRPPATDPLFPNLRYLYVGFPAEATHLLSMPLPSLVSLNLAFIDRVNSDILRGSLEQASKFSPNISELWIQVHRRDTSLSKFLSGCVCRWRNLQTLFCSGIALDKDALVNLSRISALTQLTFLLNDTSVGEITSSALPFVFSNLHYFTLYSEFLDLTSRCLSRLQLPAITDFAAIVSNCPSKLDVSSFLASLQTLGADHTIQRLELYHEITSYNPYIGIDSQHVLILEDLQPCMAFTNLRSMYLDIGWDVGLTSSDLLKLALAWPSLEDLVINREWGWNTPSGISPHGLLQLLQTCRSLNRISPSTREDIPNSSRRRRALNCLCQLPFPSTSLTRSY